MTSERRELIESVRRLRSEGVHPQHSLENPAIPETLGSALAKRLASATPETVVVWSDAASAVLGHVVARELSAGLVHAFADEGILGLSADIAPGSRVIAVSYDWTEYPGLNSMTSLLASNGGTVVGIGSVLTPPAVSDSATVVSLEDEP